ncbi:MAG: hypothetical protein AMJ73_09760 [candidate division Zixibacteria bacterium SM1_73]|nr:MAG: hypothetical protein AMJ73_09760 [candidate division Zixibacteria bacterium SM1_73]
MYFALSKNNANPLRTALILKSAIHKKNIAKITPVFAYLDAFSRFCKSFLYNQLTPREIEDEEHYRRLQILTRRVLRATGSGQIEPRCKILLDNRKDHSSKIANAWEK